MVSPVTTSVAVGGCVVEAVIVSRVIGLHLSWCSFSWCGGAQVRSEWVNIRSRYFYHAPVSCVAVDIPPILRELRVSRKFIFILRKEEEVGVRTYTSGYTDRMLPYETQAGYLRDTCDLIFRPLALRNRHQRGRREDTDTTTVPIW